MKRMNSILSLGAAVIVSVNFAMAENFTLNLRRPAKSSALGTVLTEDEKAMGVLDKYSVKTAGTRRGLLGDTGTTESNLDVGDTINLTLFDDKEFTLKIEKAKQSLGRNVYNASIDGVFVATIIETENGLAVSLENIIDGNTYKVEPEKESVSVLKLKKDRSKIIDKSKTPSKEELQKNKETAKGVVSSSLFQENKDKNIVDILIVYDIYALSFLEKNKYLDKIEQLSIEIVERMNNVLLNSGVKNGEFRLVGIECIKDIFVQRGTIKTSNQGVVFMEKYINTVNDMNYVAKFIRDSYCADIVNIVTDGMPTMPGSPYIAGISSCATQPGIEEFAGWQYMWEAQQLRGYTVNTIQAVIEGNTMTHEIGHLLGAGHSDEQQEQRGPQLFQHSAGAYAEYPHKATISGTTGSFAGFCTLMSYGFKGPSNNPGPCYYELPVFSSPAAMHNFDGKTFKLGDEKHNNAATIEKTIGIVANFRKSKDETSHKIEPLAELIKKSIAQDPEINKTPVKEEPVKPSVDDADNKPKKKKPYKVYEDTRFM